MNIQPVIGKFLDPFHPVKDNSNQQSQNLGTSCEQYNVVKSNIAQTPEIKGSSASDIVWSDLNQLRHILVMNKFSPQTIRLIESHVFQLTEYGNEKKIDHKLEKRIETKSLTFYDFKVLGTRKDRRNRLHVLLMQFYTNRHEVDNIVKSVFSPLSQHSIKLKQSQSLNNNSFSEDFNFGKSQIQNSIEEDIKKIENALAYESKSVKYSKRSRRRFRLKQMRKGIPVDSMTTTSDETSICKEVRPQAFVRPFLHSNSNNNCEKISSIQDVEFYTAPIIKQIEEWVFKHARTVKSSNSLNEINSPHFKLQNQSKECTQQKSLPCIVNDVNITSDLKKPMLLSTKNVESEATIITPETCPQGKRSILLYF